MRSSNNVRRKYAQFLNACRATRLFLAAERTRQADDIDKAFAGLADGVGELKEQIRNNTERQEMVREAESRKCQLEIEFLEKRKS